MPTLSHAQVEVFRIQGVDMKVGSAEYTFIPARAGATFVPTLLVARTTARVGSSEQFAGLYSIGNNESRDNIFIEHALDRDPVALEYLLTGTEVIDLSSDSVLLRINTAASGTALVAEFFLEGYYFASGYSG